MKRLLLGSLLVGAGAFTACTGEAPAPVDNSGSGGSAASGGSGGTGQGGMTAGIGGSTTGGSAGTMSSSGGSAGVGGAGGAGGTSGGASGGSSGMATGGSSGAPAGGTGGEATGGSSGMPGGGAGGSSGSSSGGAPGAGMGGMAGSLIGMGGMAGAGMAGMGMAGSLLAGMGGMGGGMGEDLTAVGAPLDGHTILMPCGMNTETRVCIPKAAAAKPCTGTGSSYAGTHSHNEQITIGGEMGVRYILTVHVRGMVEAKTYNGGQDRNSSGTQVPADGLYTGGTADNSGNGYNIYFIRTNSPMQHYYLNSVGISGDNRIRHSVFEIDYDVDVPVDGGSTVCLVSADPNTSAIKNCKEPDVGSQCNPMTLMNLDAATAADVGTQPYNGQFVGITVKSVKRM